VWVISLSFSSEIEFLMFFLAIAQLEEKRNVLDLLPFFVFANIAEEDDAISSFLSLSLRLSLLAQK
jgi:hypothetical protein